ncbi:hypothetical protein BT96DRAFT_960625 [Gymnopus androsaceus JB14]|uniref:Uncharacterized protein n=1 Tax=Gymnopus androsaceus JB14 TaxID=1447944 RepID=A0A6A4GLR3_9AGAR|nr:hypothetical protein BT96DRAFT_960625 [Gymnopus androsaceus JB14]
MFALGDMPAIAKLMCMKGVNGKYPCHACKLLAVSNNSPVPAGQKAGKQSRYPALQCPDGFSYDPLALPLCTHSEFIAQAAQVDKALNKTTQDTQAKEFGINGLPTLTSLPSLSFPASFPHDFMHIIENIIPVLVDHWTGKFKGLDTGSEDYELMPLVWAAIGCGCVESSSTIPSSFGCRNMVPFCHHPGFHVQRRFKKKTYYDHFILLVKLIHKCLQFQLSTDEINDIEQGFAKWVEDYER